MSPTPCCMDQGEAGEASTFTHFLHRFQQCTCIDLLGQNQSIIGNANASGTD